MNSHLFPNPCLFMFIFNNDLNKPVYIVLILFINIFLVRRMFPLFGSVPAGYTPTELYNSLCTAQSICTHKDV